mgnify:FL=1
MGRFYYSNREFKKAEKIYLKTSEKAAPALKARSLCSLARIYSDLGDYYKSIIYYDKGIKIYESNNLFSKSIIYYSNYAKVYDNIKTEKGLRSKIKLLKRLDSLSEYYPLSTKRRYILNNHFANSYGNSLNFQFTKALEYYKKNLDIAKQVNSSRIFATTYNNIADLYLFMKNDSAHFFINKGLSYVKRKELKSILLDNHSQFYKNKDSLHKALEYINKAINTNLSLLKNSNLITKSDINNSVNLFHLLGCFKKKSEILINLYESNKNQELLKDIISISVSVENIVDLILNSSSENNSKSLWRNEASSVFSNTVYAAQILNENDLAFYYMEKNRSLLLIEAVIKNIENINLPLNITNQEKLLHKNIYALENFIEANEMVNYRIKDSLFTLKLQYNNFIDSIKSVFPNSFNRRLKIKQVSLKKLQNKLDEYSIVVSYLYQNINLSNKRLLGLLISKDTVIPFKVNNLNNLKSKIENYTQLISKPLSTNIESINFKMISHELHEILLPQRIFKGIIKNKNITIIPDGNLQTIPFESLMLDNKYLIESSYVNYNYSISFSHYNNQIEREAKSDFIGYSPNRFTYNTSLVDLQNTTKEVESIERIINGKVFVGEKATKEAFLKNSNSSKIIHLATHSGVEMNPWIAFSNNKMSLYEIYNSKFNSDLVVLSSCSTNLGAYKEGEGVLSLARGFFYSGSKSVISSLWDVNDASTYEIMNRFYKNLASGQTKNKALTNAKRAYLETHSLSEKSPYYWSSFVLIGDVGEIQFENNYLLYFCFLLLLAFIFLFLKYKK